MSGPIWYYIPMLVWASHAWYCPRSSVQTALVRQRLGLVAVPRRAHCCNSCTHTLQLRCPVNPLNPDPTSPSQFYDFCCCLLIRATTKSTHLPPHARKKAQNSTQRSASETNSTNNTHSREALYVLSRTPFSPTRFFILFPSLLFLPHPSTHTHTASLFLFLFLSHTQSSLIYHNSSVPHRL